MRKRLVQGGLATSSPSASRSLNCASKGSLTDPSLTRTSVSGVKWHYLFRVTCDTMSQSFDLKLLLTVLLFDFVVVALEVAA